VVLAPLFLAALPLGSPVADFSLRDHRGAPRSLSDWRDRKLLVVAFLGVDCPLVKLYTRRLNEIAKEYGPRVVAVIGINSNQHDQLHDIARFARAHEVSFPLLKDSDNHVADLLGATRTPEVFLLDQERKVRYRGRIDDQYGTGGVSRAKPTRRDLVEAIEELLAGRVVSQPETVAVGCIIDRLDRQARAGRVTYTRDVAPILHQHCVVCHRSGEVAPFPLTNYQETIGWAETIRDVVEEGRMPPWHADPAHGKFHNDPRLSDAEKKRIAEWVKTGCPEGDPAELPPLPAFPEGWNIPEPDVVVPMPEAFTVPAEGVIEYQEIEVDPGFTEDRWVSAAEIRPGNRTVVHHATVFLKPPGADDIRASGKLGSYCLAATAPGTPPLLLPGGMAKRIPAGWKLVFVMHYVAVGTVQQDRTSVGLVFADPQSVRKEVATFLLHDPELRIPPRAPAHTVEKSWTAPADVLLLAMFPHMHLRGKSFRYEAHYPDGTAEVLLNVPRYDFGWQHRYELAEPKRLPEGTEIRCVAVYDNSAENPANPNPEVEVLAGKQSWDEMFNGYFEWCLADEDLTRGPTAYEITRAMLRTLSRPAVFLPLLAAVCFCFRLRRKRLTTPQR
jgi:peroxiredoxin